MLEIALPLLLLGTAAPGQALPDGPAILALDQARADAEAAHDAPALRRVLDERFTASPDASARLMDRDAYLRRVGGRPRGARARADLSDRELKIDGDAAVLFETETLLAEDGGAIVGGTRRVTVIYIRRDDGWRAFAMTASEAPATR